MCPLSIWRDSGHIARNNPTFSRGEGVARQLLLSLCPRIQCARGIQRCQGSFHASYWARALSVHNPPPRLLLPHRL